MILLNKSFAELIFSCCSSSGTDKQMDKSKQVPSCALYLAAASALLGAVGMGLNIGYTSPALGSMSKGEALPQISDPIQHSWIGSSMTLGALFGALASAWVSQTFGRKMAIILYGIPFTIGWLCIGFATSYEMIIAGRVITGMSTGFLSGTAPTYVKEISTIATQGVLGTGFQICVTIGILLVYVFGTFLNWKMLAFACAIPTVAMSLLMVFMPETPSWLLSHNRPADAEASMKRLRGEANPNAKELEDIEAELKSQPEFSMSALFAAYGTYAHFMPCVLALLLNAFQQLSGINAVMFYSGSIFAESKVPIDPNYCSLIVAVVQVLVTCFCGFLISRLGRKTLLYSSGILHVISLAALGGYYYAVQNVSSTSAGFIPVVCLVIFIIGFSTGWGPVPWLMIPEFTPLMSRSATAALATAVNWGCAFIISKFFQQLTDAIYKHGAFFLFSFICLLSIIFAFFMLPETKDKKDAEIAQFFKRGRADSVKSNNGQELRQLNP